MLLCVILLCRKSERERERDCIRTDLPAARWYGSLGSLWLLDLLLFSLNFSVILSFYFTCSPEFTFSSLLWIIFLYSLSLARLRIQVCLPFVRISRLNFTCRLYFVIKSRDIVRTQIKNRTPAKNTQICMQICFACIQQRVVRNSQCMRFCVCVIFIMFVRFCLVFCFIWFVFFDAVFAF